MTGVLAAPIPAICASAFARAISCPKSKRKLDRAKTRSASFVHTEAIEEHRPTVAFRLARPEGIDGGPAQPGGFLSLLFKPDRPCPPRRTCPTIGFRYMPIKSALSMTFFTRRMVAASIISPL